MTETTSATTPLALVTGASSGIGLELAKLFVAHGFDVIVNAEDAGLDEAADSLRAAGTEVQSVRADLRTYDGVEELYAAVTATGRPLAAAALNAGIGQGGAFLDNDVATELAIIDLNVTSTVHLAHRVLTDMVARDAGRVLVTSSIVSAMPGTFHAIYNASKSFVQSFVEALQNEIKDSSVTITALMPGATDTDFFRRAGMLDTLVGKAKKDDPVDVAAQGFEAMMAGDSRVVAASIRTKVQDAFNKVLPDKVKAAMHRKMAEPGSES